MLDLLEPLPKFGGHCPECSDYYGNHYCLHPPHLLELLSHPLVFLELLLLLLSKVAITQYNYSYH